MEPQNGETIRHASRCFNGLSATHKPTSGYTLGLARDIQWELAGRTLGACPALLRGSAFGGILLQTLFVSLVTKFPSCRRDFPVDIWTTSPDHELTDDFGSDLEALYRSAMPACFVFGRQISRMTFWGFCNTIEVEADGRQMRPEPPLPGPSKHPRGKAAPTNFNLLRRRIMIHQQNTCDVSVLRSFCSDH
jgi:hypothetical protein